jgi:hypothetical protein
MLPLTFAPQTPHAQLSPVMKRNNDVMKPKFLTLMLFWLMPASPTIVILLVVGPPPKI